jgi:capsular polysaccharide export protein
MSARPIAFIAPGPNLVQYLAAVGERLAPGYRAVFFSRRVKSRSLLRRLGQAIYPKSRWWSEGEEPHPVAIDAGALAARLRKVSDRAALQQGAPEVQRLASELDAFIETIRPAAVFCWNGSGLTAGIAAQLARARGIPVLFAENGYLPNTLQLDPEGVNALASIARAPDLEAIRALSYPPDQLQAFEVLLAEYRAGRMPGRTPPARGRVRPGPLAYLIQAWADWHERDPRFQGNRRIPRAPLTPPEPFVFFPLQVRSDSQLTMHSPLYGNRLDLAIADLDAAVRALDPSPRLVIKLHPADLGKTDYDPLVERFPNVLWTAGGDVRSLLQRAACVVTVNSTVGIEAMVFGRPLVTLGENFYTREGLVHPVRARDDLAACLRQALIQPPDAELVGQYLRYLYLHAFVRAHWRDFSEASLGNLARRIIVMIETAPAQVAAQGGSPMASR